MFDKLSESFRELSIANRLYESRPAVKSRVRVLTPQEPILAGERCRVKRLRKVT